MGLKKQILTLIACTNAINVIDETREADLKMAPIETQLANQGSDLNWQAFKQRIRSFVPKSAKLIPSPEDSEESYLNELLAEQKSDWEKKSNYSGLGSKSYFLDCDSRKAAGWVAEGEECSSGTKGNYTEWMNGLHWGKGQ